MPPLSSRSFSAEGGGGASSWTSQTPPWTPPPPPPPPPTPPSPLMPSLLIANRIRAWQEPEYQLTLDDMATAAALNLAGGEAAYALLLAKMGEHQAYATGDVPNYLQSLNVELQVVDRLGLQSEYRQALQRLNDVISPTPGANEGDIAVPGFNPGSPGGPGLPQPPVPPTPPPPFLEDQEAFLSLIELMDRNPTTIGRDMQPRTVGGAEWLLRGGEPAAAASLARELAVHTTDDLGQMRLLMTELLANDQMNEVEAADIALTQLRQQLNRMLQ